MKVIYKSQKKTYSKSIMSKSNPISKEKDHKTILKEETLILDLELAIKKENFKKNKKIKTKIDV
ncbi:MAG: hypothetical protein HQ505_00505 [Nitrosopumilus sp.]|nr:hypothetical protein [Nitrosopumilus sp.]